MISLRTSGVPLRRSIFACLRCWGSNPAITCCSPSVQRGLAKALTEADAKIPTGPAPLAHTKEQQGEWQPFKPQTGSSVNRRSDELTMQELSLMITPKLAYLVNLLWQRYASCPKVTGKVRVQEDAKTKKQRVPFTWLVFIVTLLKRCVRLSARLSEYISQMPNEFAQRHVLPVRAKANKFGTMFATSSRRSRSQMRDAHLDFIERFDRITRSHFCQLFQNKIMDMMRTWFIEILYKGHLVCYYPQLPAQ